MVMKSDRDQERQRVFTRRALMIGAGQLALTGVLAGRLYYLQVMEQERYDTLAEDNRVNVKLLAPPRGEILDRFGRKLATNRQNYRVTVTREQAKDLRVSLDRLAEIVEVSDRDVSRILKEAKRRRAFVPLTVRENLSWEEVSRIEVNIPDLPGVAIEVGLSRSYPFGTDGAHVLGYVSEVSESELTDDPLLQLPGFRIGKNGVEKVYDEALRGSAGRSHVEVNALGRIIGELERHDGQSGQRLDLTIDIALQKFAVERFGEESGSAVVMDVHTGEVMALVSTPAFDPNAFSRGLTPAEWDALISNERGPLTNKAATGVYPPGSTFKMATALAALDAGVITADQRVWCPGHYKLGTGLFHCWRKQGHGHVDMREALEQSCDVYFYEIAKRVGIDRITAMANKLGLGLETGIELPSEKRGLTPTTSWKQATRGQKWVQGETLIAGIGQGFVLATPLQLAVMSARLANGGLAVSPTLVRRRPAEDGEPAEPESLGLSKRHLDIIRQGMVDVVHGDRGTARHTKMTDPDILVAGKTGTAQVRRITMAERRSGIRDQEDLPWKFRHHALYVCFAPADQPKYAVAVVVEHGGSGSKAAAPVAHDILEETLRRDPAGTAPPLAARSEEPREG
ncbi:MAG: penicillin-binding protein 2 [Alphaproteobacteria bacterium]|nr:penicillin-binding protein 2 [Alphaproteobacteria bacterium]